MAVEKVKCAGCRRQFQPARAGTKFCGRPCKDAAYRKARQQRGASKSSPSEAPPEPSPFEVATRVELERLRAVDTMLGQQVLTIARRMGRDSEAGATMATLSREHSRLMDLIEARAANANDPVNRWEAAARDKRQRAATG